MYDKHLDYFIMTADCGSFSKAAEKAFLSTNAVIKQINLLEHDLGVTLFIRTNHGVKLTESGEVIYKEAKRIIVLSEQAIQKAKQAEKAKKQTIRIGTSLLRPSKTIIELWASVSENYPEIQLEIVPFDDTYSEWVSVLKSLGKRIDILAGVYPSTIGNHNCQVLKLSDVPLCCAVSRKNKLSEKKSISFTDLYGETLLVVERGDTSYIDEIRDIIEGQHPRINIRNVPSYDTKTFNLCDSLGCAMITIETWADLHPSLVTIPTDWVHTIPYGIIYSEQPSENVRTFVERIKSVAYHNNNN